MKSSKTLFWFQVALIPCSLIPQAYILLQGKTAGLTISFFLINTCFFGLNLYLARQEKHQAAFQMYLLWGMGCIICMLLALYAGLGWVVSDTYTSSACIAVALLVIGIRRLQGVTVIDPLAKGIISGSFGAILHAQVIYAMFLAQSSAGLNASMLIVAHIAITTRILQVCDSKPLFTAEAIREISVIAASIAWWYYR